MSFQTGSTQKGNFCKHILFLSDSTPTNQRDKNAKKKKKKTKRERERAGSSESMPIHLKY